MNISIQKLALFACLGCLLLTTGCFDTDEDYTINPDGSGKVVHECTFQAVSLDNSSTDSGRDLTNAVRSMLEQAKGVDAWRDVSFKTLDDGRIYFKGTAYFKDLSKFEISSQTMLEFVWDKNPAGGATLTVRTNKSENNGPMIRPQHHVVSTNLSPEELAKAIKKQRNDFQQSKPMLAGILGPMKHAVTLHLPGKVVSSSNFTTNANGNLTITFDGKKLLAAMDKLVNDDEWCRTHNGTGFDNIQDKPTMDVEINELVYGQKAPVMVSVNGGTPLFDYATEVASAKNEYAQIRKQLRVNPASPDDDPAVSAAPATGGLKSVKVAGVRLIAESDAERNLRAFNYDAGYSIALLVEFPGAIQSISDNCELDTAQTDDNSSLLPDSDWDRKVHFPTIAKDKTAAILEYKLNLPGSGVKSLKEISGHIRYRVSNGTKELDLGFENLKADANGTNFDAQITSLAEGWQKNGSQVMALHLSLKPTDIKSVSLMANGQKTELRQSGYGGGGNSFSFNYEYKQAFPADGHLLIEVYDKVQEFDAPFKLENLTLLGTPIKN